LVFVVSPLSSDTALRRKNFILIFVLSISFMKNAGIFYKVAWKVVEIIL
jgi:hypothetical protein